MAIIFSQVLLLALTIARVGGANVHSKVNNLRKAAEEISASNEAIMAKMKSVYATQEKLRHLERSALHDVNALMAEQKRIVDQETRIKQKMNLLDELNKMKVTSSEGLSNMIAKEQQVLKENHQKIMVPKRESLRKTMAAIRYLEHEKLNSAKELGSDIEKGTSNLATRKAQLKRKFRDLGQKIAVGVPEDIERETVLTTSATVGPTELEENGETEEKGEKGSKGKKPSGSDEESEGDGETEESKTGKGRGQKPSKNSGTLASSERM